jgi:signal peptidase II
MKKSHLTGGALKILALKILALSILAIILDQASKFWVVENFTYTRNPGIAFGLPITGTTVIVLNLILLAVLAHLACKEINLKKPLAQVASALILGGAIGNIIDRFHYGYVVDFISIGFWPNFNLADAFITTGVLLLLVFYGRIKR